jgi:hypothetical protein
MNKFARILRRSIFPAALLVGLSSPALAQDAAGTQQITPEAQAVLDRMTNYMKGLQAYSIQAHGTRDEVIDHGYKLQHNETRLAAGAAAEPDARLDQRRPAQPRVRLRRQDHHHQLARRQRLCHDAGDRQSRHADWRPARSGVELPLIDVLYQATAGTLTEQVRTGQVVGDSEVEGVPCDHLAFRQVDADWQLWVEKGARALPRKIVITTRNEVGDPQFSAVLTWNTQPKFDKNSFVFAPPKDARHIRSCSPKPMWQETANEHPQTSFISFPGRPAGGRLLLRDVRG